MGGFDQIGMGTATDITENSVTDTGLALEPDALKGRRLRFDGIAAGHAFLIVGNTDTTITVSNPKFTSPPELTSSLIGTHFVIERPNVTITYPVGMRFVGDGATELVLLG